MPTNVVKTSHDETLWNEAKVQASHEGHAGNYAYVMGIFQRMKGRAGTAKRRMQRKKG